MRLSNLIHLLLMVLLCGPAMAAEDDEPPAEAPAQEKKSPPKPPPYEELPYPLLLKKAETGDLKAQFELGSRYNYGRDLPKNTREALRWLRKAAQSGNTDAQRLLAVKLFEGHDVTVDQEEAFKWAQRLADAGDRPGQFMLGNLYANGEGTDRNLIRAYMWFDIAATPVTGKEPDEPGKKAMTDAATARDQISSLLLPEEEVEAQQLANDWWLAKQAPKPVPKSTKRKSAKPAAAESKPTKI